MPMQATAVRVELDQVNASIEETKQKLQEQVLRGRGRVGFRVSER